MTPERLNKIRAIAEDMRGDPATRRVAMEILRKWGARHPSSFEDVEDEEPPPPKNPPGMKNSDEYEQHRFMSLFNWGRSGKGNLVHTFSHKGKGYRITLFTYPKTGNYGWVRTEVARGTGSEVWSNKFRDMQEAHADAWTSLMRL